MVARMGTTCAAKTFKIVIIKIQHGGQPPSWEIENSPYVSNGFSDLDEIYQSNADLVSQTHQPLKIWFFLENPRWRPPPFPKSVKSQYIRNHLTDFDEICLGDARIGTPYARGHLKSHFVKCNMADSRHLEKSKIRHISATDRPILLKLSRLTQIGSLKRISR